MSSLGHLIVALAVAVAVTAAIADVRERRIPNRLTYPAMLAGMAVQGVLHGWKGLGSAAAGGLFFGGIFFLFYLVRAMGAGDVKLAAALGCIVGLTASFQVMYATALCGGALAIIQMVRSKRIGEIVRNTLSVAGHHARHGLQAHPLINLDNPRAARMPYGLAFAAGTLFWAVAPFLGR